MFNHEINISEQSNKLSKKRVSIVVVTLTLIITLISGLMIIKSSLDYSMEISQAKKYGNFYGYISNMDINKLNKFKKDKKLKNVYTSQSLGYAANSNYIFDYTEYLHIIGIDSTFINNMPINIVKGRMPKNSNEIILPDYVINNEVSVYKLGQKITLNVGQRLVDGEIGGQTTPYNTHEQLNYEKTMKFRIVGFYRGFNYEGELVPGFSAMTIGCKNSEYKGLYDVYFRTLKAKDFKNYRNSLIKDDCVVNTNSSVLMVSGQSYITQSKYTTSIIVILLICLILIISKQFQYLENKKIYKWISGVRLKILALISMIVISLGLVLGLVGAYIIVKCMKGITINCFSVFEFELKYHVYLNSVARIVLVSAIIIVSAWIVNIITNCINRLSRKLTTNSILTSIFIGIAMIGSIIIYLTHIVKFLGLKPNEVHTYIFINILSLSWLIVLSIEVLINVIVSMHISIENKVGYFREQEDLGHIDDKDIPKIVSKLTIKYAIAGAIYAIGVPIFVDYLFYYMFSCYLTDKLTLPYVYIGISILFSAVVICLYRLLLSKSIKSTKSTKSINPINAISTVDLANSSSDTEKNDSKGSTSDIQ